MKGYVRYAVALVAVVIGVGFGLWLEPLVDPTVLLLTAVSVAAWFSGLWPALMASVAATIAIDYFFTPPGYTLSLDAAHIPRLLVFTLMAGLFAGTSAARRSAERALKESRDELDAKVRERTADLVRTHEALREQADHLEELAGRLINAQEQERSRIGRELHDHISQMLGVLTIRIDQLRADESTPPEVAAALEELRQSTSELTDDIHSLSHRLHSSTLDYLGLVPALQKLVSEFSARHGIAVEFKHEAVPDALPSEVALCLFRVAEESLTNIAKHSQARSARVQVNGGPDGLRLTVEDAGTGFDVEKLERGAGLGFVSMRERLRVLRGTIGVDSAPSRGTRIEVWVPRVSTA
jgi:signal transduction histidine kinase